MLTPLPPDNVQKLVSTLVNASGQTVEDICRRAGFQKPSVLEMIVQGQVKLSLDKAGPLARACDVDPLVLIRVALREYHPELWTALVAAFGEPLTDGERRILDIYRHCAVEGDLRIDSAAELKIKAALYGLDRRGETPGGG